MKADAHIRRTLLNQDRENAIGIQRMVNEYFEEGIELPQDIEDKIERRCKRYGNLFDRMHLLTGISRDLALASEFCKKATRQGKAEEAQLVYLHKRGLNIDRLPTAGPSSIRLIDGELVIGSTMGMLRKVGTTKSFDAQRKKDLLVLKWTDGEGGAQDNQAGDVLQFLDQAKKYVKNHRDKTRFVAILDGKYYKKRWDLFKQYASSRILIETSDSYIENVKSIKIG